MIEHNPECYDYYNGFLANKGVDSSASFICSPLSLIPYLSKAGTNSEALKILRNFSNLIPKANAPRRLALNLAVGEEFAELIKPYLLSAFDKGIPSLFVDIKSLYEDPSNKQTIEEIAETARKEYDSTPSESQDPTTFLWILYFLAQHYSHLGQSSKSISLLDLALNHTPTLPEFYTCKGRTLKRAGDLIGAARALDEARLLDGQDRFLNTKCAKYLLRAGFIDEASSVLGLFTKVLVSRKILFHDF